MASVDPAFCLVAVANGQAVLTAPGDEFFARVDWSGEIYGRRSDSGHGTPELVAKTVDKRGSVAPATAHHDHAGMTRAAQLRQTPPTSRHASQSPRPRPPAGTAAAFPSSHQWNVDGAIRSRCAAQSLSRDRVVLSGSGPASGRSAVIARLPHRRTVDGVRAAWATPIVGPLMRLWHQRRSDDGPVPGAGLVRV